MSWMKNVTSWSPEKLTSKLFLTCTPNLFIVWRNFFTPYSSEVTVVSYAAAPNIPPICKLIFVIYFNIKKIKIAANAAI
jgi:hypothetical protein